MEIKYQLFTEEKLIIEKFSGVFSVERYFEFSQSIINQFDPDLVEKILVDLRNLEFAEMPEDFNETLDKIMAFRKRMNTKIPANSLKSLVFWVDKPIPTVIAHIFVNSFPEKNYSYCSTVEHIIEIFKLPNTFVNLESMVNKLEYAAV